MASLALMVSVLFLTVLMSGLLALLFSFFGFKILVAIFGLLAIVSGIFWCSVAPFPISLVGGASALMGLVAINKL